jgi:hypothetical protein
MPHEFSLLILGIFWGTWADIFNTRRLHRLRRLNRLDNIWGDGFFLDGMTDEKQGNL